MYEWSQLTLLYNIASVCTAGLDQTLEEHTHQLVAHCICGHDLLKLSQQQLEYLKVH